MTVRSTYHHGDLRNALVSAAVELLAEKGAAGLSMAEAARRAGVSGAAPYRHFASRSELLSAAVTTLTRDLLARVGEAERVAAATVGEDPDPVPLAEETLTELTRVRILFSLSRGLGLDLVYAAELRDVHDEERRDVTRQLFEHYLWPAMTITGDAVAAERLLRQSAAISQGYLGLASGTGSPRLTTRTAAMADEAAEAVRTLARAARGTRTDQGPAAAR